MPSHSMGMPAREWDNMNDPFNIFADLNSIDSMFKELMRGFSNMDIGTRGKPATYGFTIKMNPSGRPVFGEFGNVKKQQGKPVVQNTTEPLVDVSATDKEVVITAEMPGVEKKNIEVRTKGEKIVVLSVEHEKHPYYKELELENAVVEDSAKAKFNNGILEVSFRKKHPGKKKAEGKKVEIE